LANWGLAEEGVKLVAGAFIYGLIYYLQKFGMHL
jgi:hypothetical protein